jgi:hypothetical protein
MTRLQWKEITAHLSMESGGEAHKVKVGLRNGHTRRGGWRWLDKEETILAVTTVEVRGQDSVHPEVYFTPDEVVYVEEVL